jgi:polysaccharide biosynthesis/export protein
MTYRRFFFMCAVALISTIPGWLAAQQSLAHSSPVTEAGGTNLTSRSTQTPTLQERNPRYQLCKGDVIDVNFSITPEFNQTLTVQPDGFVTLRDVGDVHVEGQTVPELTRTLQTAYKNILHEPVISIVLKDFEKPYFIVGGQVGKPGKYDLRGDTTVVQALQIAGGMEESAKHSEVYLFRRVSNDWVETTKLNVKKMMSNGSLAEDLHLRPGDMVFVPKNTFSKIQRFIPTPNIGTFFPIPIP